MADEKKTVILDFQVDTKSAVVSIENLTKANKALRDERKSLDLSTDSGKAKAAELNSQIDKNTAVIKDNSSALEKQRLNVGNYTGALDKLVPGLGATVNGISSMTKAAYAFIANPIGIVIGAIGLALGALISYFKGSGDGADKLSFIMAGLKGTMNVLKDVVMAVGRAIYSAFEDPKKAIGELWEFLKQNFYNRIVGLVEFLPKVGEALNAVFHGDFTKAAIIAGDAVAKITLGVDHFTEKVAKLTEEIISETKASYNLAKQLDEVEDRERRYALSASKVTLEIQRLTLAAKNRNLTSEQSMKLLDKAAALETKRADELVAIRTKQLELTLKEEAMRLDLERQKGESLDAFAARLVDFEGKQGALTDEGKDRIIAAVQAVDSARGDSLNLLEKLKNKEDAIFLKSEAERQKARDEELKALKENADEENRILDAEQAAFDKQLADDKKRKEAEIKFQKEATKEKVGSLEDMGSALAGLGKKSKELAIAGILIQKATSISQIISSTGIAISKAFAASPLTFGLPWSAVAGVSGALQVANTVLSASQALSGFKKGGYTGDGNPNQGAGLVHKSEFVMPADIVSKFGKEHFQSYMDGSIMANAATGGMGGSSQPKIEVNLGLKEFNEFSNRVKLKESIVTA